MAVSTDRLAQRGLTAVRSENPRIDTGTPNGSAVGALAFDSIAQSYAHHDPMS